MVRPRQPSDRVVRGADWFLEDALADDERVPERQRVVSADPSQRYQRPGTPGAGRPPGRWRRHGVCRRGSASLLYVSRVVEPRLVLLSRGGGFRQQGRQSHEVTLIQRRGALRERDGAGPLVNRLRRSNPLATP